MPGSRSAVVSGPTKPAAIVWAEDVLGTPLELQEVLTRRSDSEVVVARQTSDNHTYCLKVIRREASGPRLRLEYEARRLMGLSSQHTPAVVAASGKAESLLVVFDYVSGPSLETLFRHRPPFSFEDSLAVIQCVLGALRDIHACGVLHRDVRPANLILKSSDPRDTMLVDFGPTRSWDSAQLGRQHGDLAWFLSPEQAGSIDQDISPASDLYSAGALFFYCLTGRSPFVGRNIGEVLLSHMTTPVPMLRELGIDVPRSVDELIQRLLRKDPRDRFQSAEAVLADLEAIKRSQAGELHQPIVIGSHDGRRTLTEPSFVGREAELRTIDRCLRTTSGGQRQLVLVESESGGGKTRFLTEVLQRAACARFRIFRGSCPSQAGQSGLTLFEGVAESFKAMVGTDRRLADGLRAWPAADLDTLITTLPKLSFLAKSNNRRTNMPEAFLEEPKLLVLENFLAALGSGERPALVIWDDCQWADEFTFKLIQRWIHRGGSTPGHVMLVAALRSEEIGPDHMLRRVSASATLRLGGLSPDEVRHLVESMAGPLPEVAIELITRASGGSPFMASAVLRGLIETGALTPRSGDWVVDSAAIEECQSSNRAALILSRRLDMLSKGTRELLAAGAVLGREFALDAAAELAGYADLRQIDALDEARRRHFVWMRPDESTCVFIHDKIRETLLDQLPAERRQQLHLAAAEHLNSEDEVHDVELAFHYDAAGRSQLALPFALRAADQARSQYVLSVAEQQFEIARRAGADLPNETRFRIAAGLGDVAMLQGDYERAERLFEEADQLASGKVEAAQVRGKLAELSFKRGDMKKSARDYERALTALGITPPTNPWPLAWKLLNEAVIQLAHTLFPRLVHRLKRPPNDVERLTLRLISGLAHAYWYLRSKRMILWAHLRGLNEAERFAPSLELAHIYADHAPAMSLITLFSRAYRYAEKSYAIRKEFGDVWGQGHSLNYHGVALYAASRYQECICKCREAIRLLERTGDFWQVHIARYQIAASLYRLGDFRAAQQEAQRNHLSGLELGDEQTSGVNLDVWARVSCGNVPRDVLERELRRERYDAQGTCHVLLADGVCRLAEGQSEEASRVLRRAIDVATESGIHNAYSMPARAWYATALRHVAEATSRFAAGPRKRRLKDALRAARRALRGTWVSKNDLPHIYRELGLVLAQLGRARAARKCFSKSLKWAERHQAEYERAVTLVEWGTVALANGWPGGQELLDQGELLLTDTGLRDVHGGPGTTGIKQTLSLADRFDTLLNDGRQIASALSESEIFELARVASLRLLRGEHCYVVQLNGTGESLTFDFIGPATKIVNRSIVQRAVESAKAIAAVDDFEADEGHATSIGRSVICAPIKVRDSVTACLYITHDQVHNLFGETEIRLADFVATIAGAACENAEGFTQLQLLNETLEQRVAERTAAAELRAVELERIANELRQKEEQLRVAIKQAEAANEAKTRFLATMSHEIRTPMNGILGMTELALKTAPNAQQRNCLNVVKRSGDALMALLNDILDLSKIEAGKLDLEQIPLDIRDVVETAVRLLSPAAYEKGLELFCRIAPDTPAQVQGDPNRLRQIIVNLLGNAIKFTDQGVVEMRVWPEQSREGDCVHFQVKDTGIGIPAEKQALIFEAFRQSDNSTTRRFGGTGLGLSISQYLVELMHGRIWVQSEPDKGSVFHFMVPLAAISGGTEHDDRVSLAGLAVGLVSDNAAGQVHYRDLLESLGLQVYTFTDLAEVNRFEQESLAAVLLDVPHGMTVPSVHEFAYPLIMFAHLDSEIPADIVRVNKPVMQGELAQVLESVILDDSSPRARRSVLPEPPKVGVPIKILLADDSPVNQEVAVGLLEYKGYGVRIANNGREVIEAIHDETFALVLMDLEMPEMDGFEATAAIRAYEAEVGRSTPIVAMSAHANHATQQRCREAGMNGHISKPVDPQKMFRAIEEALSSPAGHPLQTPDD